MNAPQFSNDNPELLCCPFCGDSYLHQGQVEVFNRLSEDAPSVAVTINGAEIPYLGAAGRNLSSRRQRLLIYFECEFCGPLPLSLGIWQHKGGTFVRWVP